MYRTLLLIIIFIIGFFHGEIVGREMTEDDFNDLFDFKYFSSLDPARLNNKIYNVLNKLEDSYYYEIYNLKSINKVRSSVQTVGHMIWDTIIRLLRKLGLVRKNQQSISSIRNVIQSEIKSPNFESDILREYLSLIYLIPISSSINDQLSNHLRRSNYQNKGYKRLRYNLSDIILDTPKYGILSFDTFEKLENLLSAFINCWQRNDEYEGLKNDFKNLIRYSPSTIRYVVTSRLKKPILKHPLTSDIFYHELEAFVCQLLTTSQQNHSNYSNHFFDCLKQIRMLESCIRVDLKRISQRHTVSSLKSVNNLQKSINDLNSRCKRRRLNTIFTIACNDKADKNLIRSMAVFFSNPINDLFPVLNAPKNVTNYLRRIILKNNIASAIIQELSALFGTYKQGKITKNKLRLLTEENYRANKSYMRISKALNCIEMNVKEIALNVIDQLHKVSIQFQKSLVNAASTTFNVDLSENLHTSKLFYQTIQRILKVRKNTEFSAKSNLIGDTGSNALMAQNYVRKPSENVIDPTKRFYKMTAITKSSSIVQLANTFLLATVFYECISMLALVISSGNRIDSSPSIPTNQGYADYDELIETDHNDNNDINDMYEEPAISVHRKPTAKEQFPRQRFKNLENRIA